MENHGSTPGLVQKLELRQSECIGTLQMEKNGAVSGSLSPGSGMRPSIGRPIQALAVGRREIVADLLRPLQEKRDLLFDAVATEDMEAALSLLAQRPFDAVLLVLERSEADFLAQLDAIRRCVPVTPIIAVGDQRQERAGLAAIRHGAQDFVVVPPPDPSAVRRSIRFAIERQALVNGVTTRFDALQRQIREQQDKCSSAVEQVKTESCSRQALEEILRQERDFNSAVLNSAATLVLVIDEDGRIVRFNRACEALTGLPAETMIGQNAFGTLMAGDNLETTRGLLLRLKKGAGPVVFRTRCAITGGTSRTVEWSGTAVRSGGSRSGHVVLVGTDLTARTQAENRLRHSERRLRLITDALPVLVAYVDAGGRYRFANRQHTHWFGLGPREMAGRNMMEIWGRSNYAHLTQQVDSALKGTRTCFEVTVSDGEGVRRDISGTFVPEFSSGEVSGFTYLITDISDHRHAQEQAHQHLLELAHASRLHSMGGMASQLAHELNQPLTAIAIFSSAVRRGLEARNTRSKAVSDALKEIESQAKRAGAIVQRLRRFVRRDDIHYSTNEINALVTEVLRLIRSEAELNEIAIEKELAEGLPAISVDTILVEQVILNVLQNAIHALAEVHDRARRITIRTHAGPEGFVTAEIRDNGPGLSPLVQEKIFSSFFTTKKDGMGMGLSISRSIVEAHGGTLTAGNGEPHGAVFTLMLPVVKSNA